MSVGIFTCLLQNFPKNRAILVQRLWGEKSCQNLFLAILRLKKRKKKKVPMAIKREGGGGKALMAWPLVDELLFFSAFLSKQVRTSRCWHLLFHLKLKNDCNMAMIFSPRKIYVNWTLFSWYILAPCKTISSYKFLYFCNLFIDEMVCKLL